jgi:hypothetical protein
VRHASLTLCGRNGGEAINQGCSHISTLTSKWLYGEHSHIARQLVLRVGSLESLPPYLLAPGLLRHRVLTMPPSLCRQAGCPKIRCLGEALVRERHSPRPSASNNLGASDEFRRGIYRIRMMCVYTVVQHRIGQLGGCRAVGRCRPESR